MAVAVDPAGAVFGIWQSAAHSGIRLANEPGSVCWNENMSRSLDANKAFYQAVFGYQYDDMSSGDFHYATFKTEGDPLGGIGDLAGVTGDEVPAHWMTYFAVADADETVATATKLGGTVLREAWDTPFGRMAVLGDDQGAVFAILGMRQAAAE